MRECIDLDVPRHCMHQIHVHHHDPQQWEIVAGSTYIYYIASSYHLAILRLSARWQEQHADIQIHYLCGSQTPQESMWLFWIGKWFTIEVGVQAAKVDQKEDIFLLSMELECFIWFFLRSFFISSLRTGMCLKGEGIVTVFM